MRISGWAMRERGRPLEAFEYEAVPRAGEALVEVCGCGVCHTDLGFLYQGVPTRHALPLVLGHEVAGRVAEVGPGVDAALIGRSVVVPAVISCGACDPCRRGREAICRQQVFPGNDVHGGFASHLVVPARGLCPVAVPFGPELARLSVVADAVSTAYQAVRQSELGPGDVAIFVGAGGVGGFGVQVAAALGARVLALDVDPRRLARCAEHGALATLDVSGLAAREVRDRVRALAKEHGLPGAEWKVFEASGTRPGQEAAFALLSFGGHLGVVGFHPGDVTVRLSNVMAMAARVEGTWGCPSARMGEALDLVVSGAVKLDPFVETHPLAQVNEVLERLRAHELERRPVLLPAP